MLKAIDGVTIGDLDRMTAPAGGDERWQARPAEIEMAGPGPLPGPGRRRAELLSDVCANSSGGMSGLMSRKPMRSPCGRS